MGTGIVCVVLAVLAIGRAVTQARWNRAHTADGLLGYEPAQLLLTLAIGVIAGIAGVYLIVRARRAR